MHPIEQRIYGFLEKCCLKQVKPDDKLLKEFGKRCEDALRKHLYEEREQEFRLRMSNIGKPLRQLMLEKKYGQGTPAPDFMLKMLHGSLDEAFVIFLLKSSGINVTAESKKVSLPVKTDNGMVEIQGELDVQIDGRTWDIKTASPYSFDNKFTSFEALAEKDDFGYMGQGFGYGKADGSGFAGWIVRNKATQELKVVEIPLDLHDTLQEKYHQETTYKVNAILNDAEMPPCEGEVEETYYKTSSGNFHLNKTCEYCPHKQKCHPGLKLLPAQVGKSGKYKWYTKLKKVINE